MFDISAFRDNNLVLDEMGDKLTKDITKLFRTGRQENMKMIVMCHKPAQIVNMARTSAETIYISFCDSLAF